MWIIRFMTTQRLRSGNWWEEGSTQDFVVSWNREWASFRIFKRVKVLPWAALNAFKLPPPFTKAEFPIIFQVPGGGISWGPLSQTLWRLPMALLTKGWSKLTTGVDPSNTCKSLRKLALGRKGGKFVGYLCSSHPWFCMFCWVASSTNAQAQHSTKTFYSRSVVDSCTVATGLAIRSEWLRWSILGFLLQVATKTKRASKTSVSGWTFLFQVPFIQRAVNQCLLLHQGDKNSTVLFFLCKSVSRSRLTPHRFWFPGLSRKCLPNPTDILSKAVNDRQHHWHSQGAMCTYSPDFLLDVISAFRFSCSAVSLRNVSQFSDMLLLTVWM